MDVKLYHEEDVIENFDVDNPNRGSNANQGREAIYNSGLPIDQATRNYKWLPYTDGIVKEHAFSTTGQGAEI